MQVLLEGKPIAGIGTGEYIRLKLAPGQHVISARIYTGRSSYLPVQIAPSFSRFFVLSMNFSGELNFMEIDYQKATDLMAEGKEVTQ